MTVERLDAGSPARARFSAHIATLEPIARASLFEPGFDLAAELDRPLSRSFAAWAGDESDGPPAGFLLATHVADELHVHSVVVDPRRRRLGVGRALATAALDDAMAAHLRIAVLEVRRANTAAIRLYRSVGFVAVRLRRDYYESPREDGVEMAAELAKGALAAFDILREI